jgi:hypothetical protein
VLMTLPTDSTERKGVPMYSGVLKYFAAALAGVARISKAGNDKHNPGEPMHHARGKSNDHADCIARHLMDVADIQASIDRGPDHTGITDEVPADVEALLIEVSQLAWRALALSQELHEQYGSAPLAPGARLPKTEHKHSGGTWVPDARLPHAAPSRGMSEFAAERLPLDPRHD